MRIIHIAQIHPKIVTGPRVSIPTLSAHLNKVSGVESVIYSTYHSERVQILGQEILPHMELEVSPESIGVFAGIYDKHYVSLARKMSHAGMPYIISPRSSLMVSSLRKSPIRKAAFLGSFGYRYLKKSKAIHYLSQAEHLNSLCRSSPYFLAGNGVAHMPLEVDFSKKEKLIAYIGRFDIRHKGLDLLIHAINAAKVGLKNGGWHVVLRGSDQSGGRTIIQEQVNELGLADLVSVGNEIWGEDKQSLLARSSVFIHTSRYEGQPQSVMEAMAYGCSVIVTPGVNMPEVRTENAGWEAKASADSIAECISKAISSGDLMARGRQAHLMAQQHFSWESSATDFLMGLDNVGLT